MAKETETRREARNRAADDRGRAARGIRSGATPHRDDAASACGTEPVRRCAGRLETSGVIGGHLERIHIVAFEMKPAAGVYLVPEPTVSSRRAASTCSPSKRPDGSVTELFVNLGVTGGHSSDVAAWRKTIEYALSRRLIANSCSRRNRSRR